ncbi:MAG TPA: DUF1127 domain-containing protein [Xanthobacteraceae bacterium]|nr:DUF1127 domain-containing protein [Xanthobacteraceae bacterium]
MSTTFFPNPIAAPASSSGPAGRIALATRWTGNVLRRAGLVLGQGVRAAIMESRYRRAAREIRNLDDRLLRDIGINRSEIDSIVRYGRMGDAGRIF